MSETVSANLFPENAAENAIVMDLVWGDHPELETIGDVRKAIDERIGALRKSYAPFVPANPAVCTCVDPFSNCPMHG